VIKKKPHIIIFNPDQWRSDVQGHLGNPAAVTPVIDSLIQKDAVSFRNAYCQNTVCTPSRCSFMTGWYPHVRGHRTMYHMLHPEHNEPNLLKILKENGYFVWWGGKNDLIPGQTCDQNYCHIRFKPSPDDFKRWGYAPQEGNHGGDLAWRGNPDGKNYYSFFKGKLDKKDKDIFCDSDWQMVLGAIDFIKNYNDEKPLCIFLPLQYPHPPYCVEEPWYSITDRNKIPPRAHSPENWEGKPAILKGIARGQNLSAYTEEEWTELRAVYYGMCSRVDYQFGLLLDALKNKKLYNDSAVFLFSDHGDYTGDFGIVEKTQNTFEDALSRVPFIVKPPADTPVKPGVNNVLTELIDFTATVYELAGTKPDYDHFGKSLLPVISGKIKTHRDAAFCEGGRRLGEIQAMERESSSAETNALYSPRIRLQITDEGIYHGKAAMCRTEKYKYIRRFYETDEFYDLENDPLEEKNLINETAFAMEISRHRDRLLTWYMETCDIVPRITDQR